MIKILIALLFVTSTCFAQQADTVQATRSIHRFAIKWGPLHLFNYYPSFQLAFEHRLGKQVTLQWDGGYVFSYDDVETQKTYNKRGYKAKLDVRYYWVFGKSSIFLAPEFYYNRVDYNKAGTFGVDCNGDDCAYYRYRKYKMQYREPGINLKVGAIHRMGKHFALEYHVGLAQRLIRYSSPDKPAGESFEERYEEDEMTMPREESRNLVQPTTSLRLGYIFD